MKTSLPKQTVVELLHYIAENEKFPKATGELKGGFTTDQIRSILRELAEGLSKEAVDENSVGLQDLRASSELSSKVRDVMSSLSPQEEHKLLSAFGLITK